MIPKSFDETLQVAPRAGNGYLLTHHIIGGDCHNPPSKGVLSPGGVGVSINFLALWLDVFMGTTAQISPPDESSTLAVIAAIGLPFLNTLYKIFIIQFLPESTSTSSRYFSQFSSQFSPLSSLSIIYCLIALRMEIARSNRGGVYPAEQHSGRYGNPVVDMVVENRLRLTAVVIDFAAQGVDGKLDSKFDIADRFFGHHSPFISLL
jgi:hypothetical protein